MIESSRLYMVDAVKNDVETIIAMAKDKANRDFVLSGSYDEYINEISDPSFLLVMIKLKIDNSLMGFALIKLDFKSDILKLQRIVIAKKGLGYGREAMEALLKYAFEQRNINRFWLEVYPHNIAGIKLYEGLGMHRDGILRQDYKDERGYLDHIIYSMLRNEYFEQYSSWTH